MLKRKKRWSLVLFGLAMLLVLTASPLVAGGEMNGPAVMAVKFHADW